MRVVYKYMTTKVLEKTVRTLSREVASLRSILIEVVSNRDDEGEYKPEFIREILRAKHEKPTLSYDGKGSLLKQIRGV